MINRVGFSSQSLRGDSQAGRNIYGNTSALSFGKNEEKEKTHDNPALHTIRDSSKGVYNWIIVPGVALGIVAAAFVGGAAASKKLYTGPIAKPLEDFAGKISEGLINRFKNMEEGSRNPIDRALSWMFKKTKASVDAAQSSVVKVADATAVDSANKVADAAKPADKDPTVTKLKEAILKPVRLFLGLFTGTAAATIAGKREPNLEKALSDLASPVVDDSSDNV